MFIVIASDGLWGHVDSEETVRLVSAALREAGFADAATPRERRQTALRDACAQLQETAKSRGSRDDIAVFICTLRRYWESQRK